MPDHPSLLREIPAHERWYHGTLRSHRCEFYPTGGSDAIGHGLILSSSFVQQEGKKNWCQEPFPGAWRPSAFLSLVF